MKQELSVDELAMIRAVLLFGSTARGDAREDSDVDLFIITSDQEKFDYKILKKLSSIFDELLPGVNISYNGCREIKPHTRAANFLAKSTWQGNQRASVIEFIYSATSEDQQILSNVIVDAQGEYAKWRDSLERRSVKP